MKTVTATQANREFAALLDRVIAGEEIGITKRGKIVARFAKVKEVDAKEEARRKKEWDAFIHRLKTQKPINVPRGTRDELYD